MKGVVLCRSGVDLGSFYVGSGSVHSTLENPNLIPHHALRIFTPRKTFFRAKFPKPPSASIRKSEILPSPKCPKMPDRRNISSSPNLEHDSRNPAAILEKYVCRKKCPRP